MFPWWTFCFKRGPLKIPRGHALLIESAQAGSTPPNALKSCMTSISHCSYLRCQTKRNVCEVVVSGGPRNLVVPLNLFNLFKRIFGREVSRWESKPIASLRTERHSGRRRPDLKTSMLRWLQVRTFFRFSAKSKGRWIFVFSTQQTLDGLGPLPKWSTELCPETPDIDRVLSFQSVWSHLHSKSHLHCRPWRWLGQWRWLKVCSVTVAQIRDGSLLLRGSQTCSSFLWFFPKTKDWGSLSYLGEKMVIGPYH